MLRYLSSVYASNSIILHLFWDVDIPRAELKMLAYAQALKVF